MPICSYVSDRGGQATANSGIFFKMIDKGWPDEGPESWGSGANERLATPSLVAMC